MNYKWSSFHKSPLKGIRSIEVFLFKEDLKTFSVHENLQNVFIPEKTYRRSSVFTIPSIHRWSSNDSYSKEDLQKVFTGFLKILGPYKTFKRPYAQKGHGKPTTRSWAHSGPSKGVWSLQDL